ncbi:MAG TPA: hypothetical protein VEH31_34930 [Streptosporangiaceae bacterium]|nr:hypothetical protein [Streptosporangiaceae bacterium]
MSASDAAPLPRLGEVFFDVRGESRTMRLSWYADTGVAVFSIWQGGTCTGTFRLPIADLPRMVEALRRGPRGHDDQVTGEQPGSREPRLPAAPGPPGPAASPRPELLDRDIGTGPATGAAYAPPAEPELTGYQAAPPPPGYPPEPPGPPGYRDRPLAGDPGYQTPPPRPGYRGKAPRRRRGSPPAPAPPAEAAPGHRQADLAGDPGGYPAGLAPAFPDEYPAGPPAAGIPAPRGSRRRGPERDEDPGGYPGEPLAPDLPLEYSGGYQDQPASGYPGEAGEGYQAEPGYPGEEALEPDYPLDYRSEDRGGPYPAGPPAGYPDEQDYPGYPDELAATEYGSPMRPYLDDPPGMPGTDEPFAGGPPEPATPRGRRGAGPSPDSFPYGPPPGSGQSRRRERYPRRH